VICLQQGFMPQCALPSPIAARLPPEPAADRECFSPERERAVAALAEKPLRYARRAQSCVGDGVTPAKLSEIITHLAFYAGWGNAMSVVEVAQDIFAERGVSEEQLPEADPELLPLDEQAEAERERRVQESYGAVSQGVVNNTRDLLFRDLWLRPALKPRDRSLVMVSAVISAGQVEQMPFHLNRAMDNGLTQEQAAEVLAHLAFYAGWPNVFSALPVAKDVFEERRK
jgi:4-carboxymuconolactone decarboxylase